MKPKSIKELFDSYFEKNKEVFDALEKSGKKFRKEQEKIIVEAAENSLCGPLPKPKQGAE